MGKSVKPMLIAKVSGDMGAEERRKLMGIVAEGISKGALVIAEDCEVTALDHKGRLVYPVKQKEG